MTDWEPERYEQFKAQRAQPFWDLVALVEPTGVHRVVDLGCGTGELTRALAERLAVARVIGVDNSPNMLASAMARVSDHVRFTDGDISRWTSAHDVDLVIANASLQWVGDHPAVLARWVAALAPGGQIAVQVPANADHHSHLASVEVAHREPFCSAMSGDVPPDPVAVNVLAPEQYSGVLHDLGCREPHVRMQVYPHLMPSTSAVADWTRGTSLTRFFTRLPDELHEPFVDAYRAELLARIGDHSPYLFTFKRILMRGRLE